jgi:hypothetical protein
MDLHVSAISFNSVGSATTYGASSVGHRPQPPRDGRDPMAPVAKALGMSAADVRSHLRGGQSLNDLAESNGLSHDDLAAAIKAGLPRDATGTRATSSATASAAAASATSATAATTAASWIPATIGSAAIDSGAPDPTAIAATKGRPPAPPNGPDGVAGASSVVGNESKLGQLSDLYNVDSTRLNSASSAKEVVDLLQQNGADLSKLKNVLNSGDLFNTTA